MSGITGPKPTVSAVKLPQVSQSDCNTSEYFEEGAFKHNIGWMDPGLLALFRIPGLPYEKILRKYLEGYLKWKQLLDLFHDLKSRYPSNLYLIQYENLINHPEQELTQLFEFVGLSNHQSPMNFFSDSHNDQDANESPTSVYKNPSVKDRWKHHLDSNIIDQIKTDLTGTIYEKYFL